MGSNGGIDYDKKATNHLSYLLPKIVLRRRRWEGSRREEVRWLKETGDQAHVLNFVDEKSLFLKRVNVEKPF